MNLPQPKGRIAPLSVRIDAELLKAVRKARPRGVSLNAVVEFGLRRYLDEVSKEKEASKQLTMMEKKR